MSQTDDHRKVKASPTAAPDPPDIVGASLTDAVAFITSLNTDEKTNQIVTTLNKFLEDLIPPPPHELPEDKCDNPTPEIAPFCAQEKLDLATSANTWQNSQLTAEEVLRQAIGTWNLAVSQYEHSVTSADIQLRAAVKAAVATYNQKNNPDSHSRSLFPYFTMKTAVASALQAFETSIATADGGLSGAAGTLIGAYTTYVTNLQAAQTTRQVGDSTAAETFWQQVEAMRDATT